QYRFTFVRGRRLTPVRPFWIRANGCNDEQPSYTVHGGGARGSTQRKTWRWRVPFDGRIVAAGGHLHAGARNMTLTQPSCDERTLVDTAPLYGRADHPAYRMRPLLHEPGPVNTRYFLSRRGIAIRRGEVLALNGLYDAEHARSRVMAIMHVYVARGRVSRARRCAPLPPDRRALRLRYRGRTTPPFTRVPLNAISPRGQVYVVQRPPGPLRFATGSLTTAVRGSRFVDANLSIPRGARITWLFADPIFHNVLLANGPHAYNTRTLKDGRRYGVRFDVPGTYQFFCYLHPMTMHQQVTVRAS
ncbi:MAG TPA: plastocyanin/azurin family copper-binding protein, partial [Solirubrobacteraceae bacterium]